MSELTVRVTAFEEIKWHPYQDEEQEWWPEGWTPRFATVWANDYDALEAWLNQFCHPTTSIRIKFNSGNPIAIIHFEDDRSAAIFKLTWCGQ